MSEKIRAYWEDRARQNVDARTATTNDVYLRELEVRTFIDRLRALGARPGMKVLDVGCGDGYTTLEVARHLPGLEFLGIDYAAGMIASAQANLARLPELGDRVRFQPGDVTALAPELGAAKFDFVLSDRCLINLASADLQYQAIAGIASLLRPGGIFLAIENFAGGQLAMNEARARVGLPPIPVRWHNLFFEDDEFVARTRACFSTVELDDFSSAYYFATRVIYSKMCQMRGEEPDYQHDIHKLAVDLPPFGGFSPIRLAILVR